MRKDLLLEELQPVQLSKNKTELISNKSQEKELSIISKYNVFVSCYNNPINQIDEKNLMFMPESKLVNSFNQILKDNKSLSLFLLALLIPFANLFLMTYLWVAACRYFNALKIFRKNQERVPDPFLKMKYDPEKCNQLKKDYYFMKIHFKSLRSEFNFKENTSLTESQGKQGNLSEWMIYNNDFASYYSDFPRWKVKFLTLMLTGIIETVISTTVLVFLMFI